MAVRKSDKPIVIGRRSEDCGPLSDPDGCFCRAAVERAYAGMVASGAPNQVAMEAATRVFRYHHPKCSLKYAEHTVETWLFTGPLH